MSQIGLVWPKALVHVGKCSQINYVNDKFDEKLREYFHKFESMPDMFFAEKPQPDGTELIVLKGKFKIEPQGITG